MQQYNKITLKKDELWWYCKIVYKKTKSKLAEKSWSST